MQHFHQYGAPRSYKFIDPDTGHQYHADSKEQLIIHITGYREQNNLPSIKYLDQVLQNYWCSLPENIGACTQTVLKRGFFQYIRGGIALLDYLFYGKEGMAHPDVAEIRAQICLDCPLNQFPDKGAFVAWSDEIAKSMTGGRKTKFDDKLGNCMGCGCPLRAKIHKKAPFGLKAHEKQTMKEANPNCWQV